MGSNKKTVQRQNYRCAIYFLADATEKYCYILDHVVKFDSKFKIQDMLLVCKWSFAVVHLYVAKIMKSLFQTTQVYMKLLYAVNCSVEGSLVLT